MKIKSSIDFKFAFAGYSLGHSENQLLVLHVNCVRCLKSILVTAFLTLACACVAKSERGEAVAYEIIDDPDLKRIEIKIRNDSSKSICLLPESWPNSSGAIASNRVILLVGENSFQIKPSNTGYCIADACATEVKPHETIESFFPYSSFDLPASLWFEKKSLRFTPIAYRCN